jgi:hypothetical protein
VIGIRDGDTVQVNLDPHMALSGEISLIVIGANEDLEAFAK